MKLSLLPILLLISSLSFSKTEADLKLNYENAFLEIDSILRGLKPYDFKRAVFITENAFLNNQLDYKYFNLLLLKLAERAKLFAFSNDDNFQYEYQDRASILLHASLFKVITDTILERRYQDTIYHLPFGYDFNDFEGKKDWKSMFVTELLKSKKGNCHSLPYLYKIIADELGLDSHLALAPNHIYLKNRSQKTGMYNTELTSASFPIDAWLMASGYIHLDAIRSGIYMEVLNKKQTITLCLIDLVQGYQRKFNMNDDFTKKCIETALIYFPHNITALLLKASNIKEQFDTFLKENNANYAKEVFHISEAKNLFNEYEALITKIHELGYRKMPSEMYMNWLLDLRENKEKYSNKKIITTFKNGN